MQDFLELTKPRITVLILICTAAGYFFGCRTSLDFGMLAHVLLGTALMASGTSALNQWYEVDSDARMHRTRVRPIPSGRMKRSHGFVFGVLLSIAGFADLWFGTNALAARARRVHAADVYFYVYAVEAVLDCVHDGGRSAGRDASTDRLCGCKQKPRCRGVGFVPHYVRLAIPSLLRDRVDVSRGLCQGRNPDAARDRAGRRFHR